MILLIPALLWCVIAFWGGLQGWWLSPVADKNDSKTFEEFATHQLLSHNKGSSAFVLLQNGQVRYEYYASPTNKVDKNTLFAAASLSKLITALGVIQLANKNYISLNAPVNSYLSKWKIPSNEFNANDITVAQLLSHTSGLSDQLGFGDYRENEVIPTLIDSLNNPRASSGVKHIELGGLPGKQWQYSGGGYLILQLLIEEVTGMSFEAWMQKSVFQPLSMTRSNYQFMGNKSNHAGSYNEEGKPAEIFKYAAAGATGLLTTAHDLTILAKALYNPDITATHSSAANAHTAKQLRTAAGELYGETIWGHGAMLFAPVGNGDYIFGHDGSNDPAINSSFRINPNNGDAIIILATGHSSLASSIAFEWTLWQSGKPDFLMINRAIKSTFIPIGLGLLCWLIMVLVYRKRIFSLL